MLHCAHLTKEEKGCAKALFLSVFFQNTGKPSLAGATWRQASLGTARVLDGII